MVGRSYYDIVREELERLEAIDNATPSEALECLGKLFNEYKELCLDTGSNEHIYKECDLTSTYNTIKQALLNAEKDEKIILGIEDYLNRRIKVEPLEDVKKAFIEIRNQLQVIKEVLE